MSSRRDYVRSRSPSSRSKGHRVHLREGSEGEYKPRKEKKHKKIHDHHLDTDSDNSHKQPEGFKSISEDDYFSKSTEFRIWLRESKDKFFDELSSEQAHRYFKKFISSWNKCKLDKKYYDGIRSSQLMNSETTRYKWKNLKINQDELDSLKHSVDRQTNTKFAMEVQMRSGKNDQITKRTIGPTMPPTSLQGGNEEMDQEDRARYERTLKRKERKDFQKTHEAVLDELIPKATGKEAMIEKKRAKNAYYRREESPDVELNERDLMGDDDFRSSFTAQKRASDAREQRKQAYKAEKAASLQEKAIAYKSKEQDTMEMFRKLAEEQRKAGRGMWSQSNNDNDS
ncbi:3920_t:CDS:2 [Funneliformis geosporum]|uniref:14963_t:CDS:1 n=1 Tax=Funneliformis geosporum TaxID=1117311 RepID=A0A9W4WMX4_9GLOM|nr:3920_t:CDS:2 [Funneliformis geosporum]CAI2173335.1 14963_t:CDS:2 [Funneliformis geosporum]